jgi:prolyl oligopeptidase
MEVSVRQAIGLIALLLSSSQSAAPQENADPYIWLEEVDGAAAVEWARVRTERTLQHLTRLPVYDSIQADLLRQVGRASPIPDLVCLQSCGIA